MKHSKLLAGRRRLMRNRGGGEFSSCDVASMDNERARESLVLIAVAFLVSLGIHGGFIIATAGAGPNRVHSRTVVTITNDVAQDDSPEEESVPEEDELLAETVIMEPDPDESGSAGSPGPEEQILDEAEETPTEGLDDQLSEMADLGPPEEVFGVDYSSVIDHGAMAVRVGNSLRVKPGRFVDPDKVRSLDYAPKFDASEPELVPEPAMDFEMPEFPDLEMPEPPKLESVEKPKIRVKREKKRTVKRTVPKNKYRKRVVPEYTEAAMDAEIEGVVTIDVWVGRNGVVKRAELVKGLGYGLDRRVVEAALKSTFNPVLADGKPSACKYRLKYRFRIEW